MSKIIITGGTGTIGLTVLQECLSEARVKAVVAFTRRNLPFEHEKMKVMIIPDFLHYSQEAQAEIKSADGFLWCAGNGASRTATPEEKQFVLFDMPDAALKVVSERTESKPFRFLYLGGMIFEQDQQKHLWILETIRKTAGAYLTKILAFGRKHNFEVYVSNVGFLYSNASWLGPIFNRVGLPTMSEKLHAQALVDTVLRGGEVKVMGPSGLVKRGKQAETGSK